MKKAKKAADNTTEEKIKVAARKVFTARGYAGARTRDIAEEAGINVALLNYYFQSKKKLFQLIMFETVQHFVKSVIDVLMREKTTLKQKTEAIASNYIEMLIRNPDVPVFILSELRSHPDQLVEKMGIKAVFQKSTYFKQLKAASKTQNINPIHYFINTMGLIVFPFVGRPILTNVAGLDDHEFKRLMRERKVLIGKWVEAMMKTK
jgi:AcrR family transcriptional regulator